MICLLIVKACVHTIIGGSPPITTYIWCSDSKEKQIKMIIQLAVQLGLIEAEERVN